MSTQDVPTVFVVDDYFFKAYGESIRDLLESVGCCIARISPPAQDLVLLER